MVFDDNKLIGHLIIEHGALKEELKSEFLASQWKNQVNKKF